MRKTRIFVSSTCYDLGAVRESIRGLLKDMGHEPVLSEYPSFPVDPLQSAISNCRRNVRDNTDVFLLLIGDQYGSVDVKTGKSITNLEFETAMLEGLPAYIFIKKSILTMLPLWKTNPDLQFPGIPNNDVFKFVNEIRSRNLWTHEFDCLEDIKSVLNDQLSIMFRDLLERRLAGKLDPLIAFRGESLKTRQIVIDKPKYWEYLLTAELLRTKLGLIDQRYRRLRNGLVHVPQKSIKGRDFFVWIQDHMANFILITDSLKKQTEIGLAASWGPLGTPGDANVILFEVSEIVESTSRIIDSERELLSHRPPDFFNRLKEVASGIGDVILDALLALPDQLTAPFADGDPPFGTKVNVTVSIPSPDFEAFHQEVQKLTRLIETNPYNLAEIWD